MDSQDNQQYEEQFEEQLLEEENEGHKEQQIEYRDEQQKQLQEEEKNQEWEKMYDDDNQHVKDKEHMKDEGETDQVQKKDGDKNISNMEHIVKNQQCNTKATFKKPQTDEKRQQNDTDKPIPKKKRNKKNNKNKDISLPQITTAQQKQKKLKYNLIRNQQSQTKQQLHYLQTRIKALRNNQQKIEKMHQNHRKQIIRRQIIRQRINSDRKIKQQVQEQRNKQNQELKREVSEMKEKLEKGRQTARNFLAAIKGQQAHEQRNKLRKEQLMVKSKKDEEKAKNAAKARQIRKQQAEMEERKRKLYESHVQQAHKNNSARIERSLQKQDRMRRKLSKLRKIQKKMMIQCEKSQASMLQTMRQLDIYNPETKNKKGSYGSRSKVSSFYLG